MINAYSHILKGLFYYHEFIKEIGVFLLRYIYFLQCTFLKTLQSIDFK